MSYCRWSSDNWKCDLYCYFDGTYYVTHVASNRIAIELPELPELRPDDDMKEWFKVHQKQMKLLDGCERISIGLPYDGNHFDSPTLDDFRDTLLMLREAGYNFPDYVLKEVKEELSA